MSLVRTCKPCDIILRLRIRLGWPHYWPRSSNSSHLATLLMEKGFRYQNNREKNILPSSVNFNRVPTYFFEFSQTSTTDFHNSPVEWTQTVWQPTWVQQNRKTVRRTVKPKWRPSVQHGKESIIFTEWITSITK